MITSLEIQNFKSIRHMRIDCKRINVFIGEPNSGKSNILEAIGFLSYLGFGGAPQRYVRTRIFRELFYDKNIENELIIKTDFVEISAKAEGATVMFRYRIYTPESSEWKVRGISVSPDGFVTSLSIDQLRFFRFYRFSGTIGTMAEPTGYLHPPSGDNLLGVLYSKPSLRELVGSLFEKFGYKLIIKPDEKRIEILKLMDGVGISLPPYLISETLLRMVFNFTIIESNKGAIIALEEPESHAFPFYVKMLAESIADDKENQYFISTHNPYFLIPLVQKTPIEDINVIVTEFSNYETKAHIVPKEKLSELLDLEIDVFFNLERLIR